MTLIRISTLLSNNNNWNSNVNGWGWGVCRSLISGKLDGLLCYAGKEHQRDGSGNESLKYCVVDKELLAEHIIIGFSSLPRSGLHNYYILWDDSLL